MGLVDSGGSGCLGRKAGLPHPVRVCVSDIPVGISVTGTRAGARFLARGVPGVGAGSGVLLRQPSPTPGAVGLLRFRVLRPKGTLLCSAEWGLGGWKGHI